MYLNIKEFFAKEVILKKKTKEKEGIGTIGRSYEGWYTSWRWQKIIEIIQVEDVNKRDPEVWGDKCTKVPQSSVAKDFFIASTWKFQQLLESMKSHYDDLEFS